MNAHNKVLTQREIYTIIGALMMGMFLSALDQTIVQTALPTITAQLHGGVHLAWVVVAYLLSSTVTVPMWGKLGDQYGRKAFFQAAIVIFLVGSAMSGLSHSFNELIAFRFFQGIGGGGLMVGAQAIIGDIVPPMERGRYSGWFGATFGTATVLGPLIGGFFTEHIGWQWCFYVNVPIGIAALFVTAAFLPHTIKKVAHAIDYSGFVSLVIAASSLVIYTSLGGSQFGWFSTEGVVLLVIGIIATAAFISVEFRAKEPILMPRLFRNRVFTSGSAISFVVGFAMFGALLFLPLFMQEVNGVSPTMSGLRILPMMAGLLGASITAGNLVSRGRKYRPFPIAGTAVMCVGLGLLGTITVTSSAVVMGVYMFILGVGIGLVMQILVTAVQNAVEYKDLGVATAGANFFRSIGGCFGTAIFGALFANVWPHNLAVQAKNYGVKDLKINPAALQSISRADLVKLGPQAFGAITHALAASVQDVYIWALPVGGLALLLSLTLPEVKLRSSFHEVPESLEPIPDMIG